MRLTVLLVVLSLAATAFAADEKYLGLPLSPQVSPSRIPHSVFRNSYGVPFLQGALPLERGGTARVNVGGRVDRIFLLGMTDQISESERARWGRRGPSELIRPAVPVDAWTDPLDLSTRFWVGDKLGRISVEYADGTTQVYRLVLGQSVWWGRIFYDYSEPLQTDAQLRNAFTSAIRLYPPGPTADGNYIAVIKPRHVPIVSITFNVTPEKRGTIGVRGITLEMANTNEIANAIPLSPGNFSPEFARFMEEKPLLPTDEDDKQTCRELSRLSFALYSTDKSFKGPITESLPPGYTGPRVSFKGNISADILAEAFYYNVQDIRDKIDEEGMYHTSTKDALSWGGYKGIGTFREGLGRYNDVAYSRDMGRSLQEITMLGYTNEALRCGDWALQIAHQWETESRLKIEGASVPQHFSMFVDRPARGSYENDGHGLTTLFIYKLWQWLPDRDEWLRAHWPDVKGLGDWILWQFDHPEISKSTNGLLHTLSESSGGKGYSVYPDCICMDALRGLAEMADSIGETNSAVQWCARADKMQRAITEHYIINDPKYGRVWTLEHSGWPNKSTVLGPLIFRADYEGWSPADENDDWRSVNEAAYQRLIDTYQPFGFYGQAMGYGQGFVSQSALLLDRMRDATTMLDWAAREIYDPRVNQFDHFIVPEGVQVTPSGQFWYRIGDLGNGVQEAEIVKTLRLVIGLDDTRPDRIQFYPRMPYGWNEINVTDYPMLFEQAGKTSVIHVSYNLKRAGKRMLLEIHADQNPAPVPMRLGPFAKQPSISDVRINGQTAPSAEAEQSGDSWWIKFMMPVK
ncbi:MAG TPA: hypothetical protein VME24_11515 [Alphaproteobacteria bacterium]|nr:hypothetical protein [Alphaproteobacteria bacterium]